MKKYDFISGIFLVVLAIVLAVESHSLAVYGPMGPKEGFFPLGLSILLCCFGIIITIKSWLVEHPSKCVRVIGPRKGKLLIYVTSFILFAFGLNPLGYTLTVVLYLALILYFVERIGWRSTTITIISTVVISYLLFVRFLGIPLPEGVLTPAANLLRQMILTGSL